MANMDEYPMTFRDEIDEFLFKECNIMGGCCSAQGNFAYMIGREVAEKAIKFAKEQMMKDAIEVDVYDDWQYGRDKDNTIVPAIKYRSPDFKYGSKVKIIIVK